MENLDFDHKHYIDFSFGMDSIEMGIFQHVENIIYIDILTEIHQLFSTMEMSNPEIDIALTVTTKNQRIR